MGCRFLSDFSVDGNRAGGCLSLRGGDGRLASKMRQIELAARFDIGTLRDCRNLCRSGIILSFGGELYAVQVLHLHIGQDESVPAKKDFSLF